MNYTKGPWHPVEYARFWSIRDTDSYNSNDLFDEEDSPNAEANALLASRSPQMYDMLKEICEVAKKLDLRGKVDYTKIEQLLKEATS